jgi:NAD(P)-dependent dehydrogenase (short-subunit alcohol dehydrogenase family)
MSKTFPKCRVTYVTDTFKKTHKTFKGLDIVINNAGILDDSRWELEIAINVVSRQY